ncbi:MAG: DUF5722 domain-containing protein [Verrucomicrobiota bacterium]
MSRNLPLFPTPRPNCNRRRPIGVALCLLVAGSTLAETSLELGPRKDVTITPQDKAVSEITVSGPTPHFWSQPVKVPASQRILAFDYFSPSGVESIAGRVRSSEGEMKFVGSKPIPLAETWQPFSLELTDLPTIETRFHLSLKARPRSGFQIRNLRLRVPNQSELQARNEREKILTARQADADAFLSYLRAAYPGEIENVAVGLETLRISGNSSEPFHLVELPPSWASHHANTPLPTHGPKQAGPFTFELPRFAGEPKLDRGTSRWRLDTPQGKIASLAKWPSHTSVPPERQSLPKAIAKSQKGIGGVPNLGRDDHPIFELGVHHATVNFVIDALMSRTQKQGWRPWQFEDRTYYFNERFLAGKDATIKRLCQNDIVVTCILLVGNRTEGELRHPDAETRGVFAMPDLTNEESAHHYRAVMHFLAQRYSLPEQRIANWVVHNEVDQAGTWTNMGDQPLARYLEAYHRSARIIYHSARQHDPHARVFISLTHHWAKQSSGHGTYTVRSLVDLWREIAKSEGVFDWGVAYHPYPQDLRNPDTWDDTDVTFDRDTPYITPKNIEVLPGFLDSGRPILLSEQGFNTPTLSLEDQKRQSDALIYMFKKLQKLPQIEAFHLHRYQDMPDREGGLRFGILDEHGNRKLGWQTYVEIGKESDNE